MDTVPVIRLAHVTPEQAQAYPLCRQPPDGAGRGIFDYWALNGEACKRWTLTRNWRCSTGRRWRTWCRREMRKATP